MVAAKTEPAAGADGVNQRVKFDQTHKASSICIASYFCDTMASPHASSFICLPFSDHSDMVTAYTVYFGVCIGSALFGVLGAVVFLVQVVHSASEAYPGKTTSQRWILIMLAISDLFADLGTFIICMIRLSAMHGRTYLASRYNFRATPI